jgi:polysaccharide biosynthesis/export protein
MRLFYSIRVFKFLKINILVLLTPLLLTFVSCLHVKPPIYFESVIDTLNIPLTKLATPEPIIEPGDFVQIKFVGKSPEVTAMLNNYGYAKAEAPSSGNESAGTYRNGIEVNREGYIDLPLIGKLKAGGLTRTELRDVLTREAGKYLQDPIVTVSGARFKISVLGEVRRPQTYEMEQAQINILEMMARAGDMADYADLQKVKIYREAGGKREMATINLNDTSAFNSPYFYLRNNDIVIVSPQKEKVKAVANEKNLPIVSRWLAITSTMLAVLNIALIVTQ